MNIHLCDQLYNARILLERKKNRSCLHWGHISIFCVRVWLEVKQRGIELYSSKNKRGWTDCLLWRGECYFQMPATEVAATLFYRNMFWSLHDENSLCVPDSVKPQSPGIAPLLFFSPFLSLETVPISFLQLHLHLPHLRDLVCLSSLLSAQ